MSIYTTINSGDEFCTVAILNEVLDAIIERQLATGIGSLVQVVDGDDVQTVAFWAGLQNTVEAMVTSFVNHTLYGGDFTGLDAIPMWTLAAWRTESGLDDDGFMAINEAGTEFRIIEKGDYINSHLLNELHQGLYNLQWTVGLLNTDNQGENNGNSYDGYWADQGTAESGARTGYDANPQPWVGPRAYTISNSEPPPNYWFARVYRAYNYFRLDTIYLNKTIDIYVMGEKVGDSFDDNGDFPGGYVEGEFFKFETIADSTNTTVYSSKFGSGPPGNYPAWPSGSDTSTGYNVNNFVAVIKWDFEYGL